MLFVKSQVGKVLYEELEGWAVWRRKDQPQVFFLHFKYQEHTGKDSPNTARYIRKLQSQDNGYCVCYLGREILQEFKFHSSFKSETKVLQNQKIHPEGFCLTTNL